MSNQLIFLWQRYFFNRDIGDFTEAAYWMKRINEYLNQNN